MSSNLDRYEDVVLFIWHVVYRDYETEGDPLSDGYVVSTRYVEQAARAVSGTLVPEDEIYAIVSMERLGAVYMDWDYLRSLDKVLKKK